MAGSSHGNIPQGWLRTQQNVVKGRFMWTLNNFSFCNNDLGSSGIDFKSSVFSIGSTKQIKFFLHLYPEGSSNTPTDRAYVSLYLVADTKIAFNANFKLSILDVNHKETYAKESRYSFEGPVRQRAGFNHFIKRELLMNEANCLLPEDNLTIICEVEVVDEIINSSGQSCAVKLRMPECLFAEDLGAMLDKQLLCDVTLAVCGTEIIKAHKFVLSARCPVFAAMFEHDMVERKNNYVDIKDVKPEVLMEMLRYIYTGRATNLDGQLLAAANMYALERLKVMCEEELWKNLTIETAAETLILADLNSADELKALTMDFICRRHEVVDTAGWAKMMTTHPRLLDEAMRALVTRKEQVLLPIVGPPQKHLKPAAD